MYGCSIEVEQDDCGFHAVIIDVADDSVVRVTNTHPRPEDAYADARAWLEKQSRPMSA